jgi:PLP dependent protein
VHSVVEGFVSLVDKIARAREQISSAAHRSGRDPSKITLMAVSKTFPPDAIREAYAAGIRVFGENRVQEFAGKIDRLRDLAGAEWRLIGHLQSNKAAKAAELFGAVDSLDSTKLAERLNAAAQAAGKTLPVLIEINIGGETTKSGVAPRSEEFERMLTGAPAWNHLSIRGLMTVPPYSEDSEGSRPFFRQLRVLRDDIAARKLPALSMEVLSMGMSHDFEVAIEEGSTCVRVGTAIFGKRQKTLQNSEGRLQK